jgi:tripartite-type tricarboxylate transporter receptor subunit TctC
MLGPAKMPPEIVAKLEADLKAALQDPNVVSTLGKIGAAPVGSSARDFDAYMHAEAVKWAPVLKAADIRAQ